MLRYTSNVQDKSPYQIDVELDDSNTKQAGNLDEDGEKENDQRPEVLLNTSVTDKTENNETHEQTE